MISTLNALISRAFVVGYIMPSLALFLGIYLLYPTLPIFKRPGTILAGDADTGGVALAILAIWLCAMVLSIFNVAMYRVLEGYVWPINAISSWKTKEINRWKALVDEYDKLQRQLAETENLNPDTRKIMYTRAQDVLVELRTDFPQTEGDILPTRLGNVIRAFERYPNVIYGADGVALWPWIEASMKDDARSIVENAKATSDLFVNICILSFIYLILVIFKYFSVVFLRLVGVISNELKLSEFFFEVIIQGDLFILAVSGLIVSIFSYKFALNAARSWGRRVRAAFDLYLNSIAEKMGYEVPKNFDDRREFWVAVSQKVLYLESKAAISILDNNKSPEDIAGG